MKISAEKIEKLREAVAALVVPPGNPGIEKAIFNVEMAVKNVLENNQEGIAVVGAARALLDFIDRPQRKIHPGRRPLPGPESA